MLNLFRKQSAKEPTTMDIAEKFIDETMDVDHSDATLLKCIMNLSQKGYWYVETTDLKSDAPAFVSPEARQLMGLPLQKEVGLSSLIQMIHADFREAFKGLISHTLKHSGDEKLLRCLIKTGANTFQWFCIRASYSREFTPPRLVAVIENTEEETSQSRKFDIVSTRFDLSREMLNDGLWDLDIIGGNPLNPDNVFWWSPQFRKLLGFETIEEFPDVMDSWASRLHPDDKQNALDAFVSHLMDFSGKTGFDIEYIVLNCGVVSTGGFRPAGRLNVHLMVPLCVPSVRLLIFRAVKTVADMRKAKSGETFRPPKPQKKLPNSSLKTGLLLRRSNSFH